MKGLLTSIIGAVIGSSWCCSLALAEDRLTLGANGSTLTDTDGGAGGVVGFLHELSPGKLIGIGAEYQSIADAHWAFGTLRGALIRGKPTSMRWSISGELNYGSGEVDGRAFDHATGTAGASLIFPGGLTLEFEDRQIDIDTTRGNLPKFGLSYLWNPRWRMGASYSQSVSGNLGTELVAARVDYFSGSHLNLFLGAASGQASPAVLNLQTGFVQPGRQMKALFVGLTKPFSRADLMLVGDYLNLSGNPDDIERFTLTLNCSIHLRARGQPR